MFVYVVGCLGARRMESELNGYQKLALLQSQVEIPKNNYNEFGGFSFRSAEDILKAIKPMLKELELIIVIKDRVINIGGMNYIEATVKLIDTSTGVLIEEVTANAREDIQRKKWNCEQLTGSASSYSRKYALQGLLLLDDNKDADSLTVGDQNTNYHINTTSSIPEKKQVSNEYLTKLKIKGILTQLGEGHPDTMLEAFQEFCTLNKIQGVRVWNELSEKQTYYIYGLLKKEHSETALKVKKYLESIYEVREEEKKAS